MKREISPQRLTLCLMVVVGSLFLCTMMYNEYREIIVGFLRMTLDLTIILSWVGAGCLTTKTFQVLTES